MNKGKNELFQPQNAKTENLDKKTRYLHSLIHSLTTPYQFLLPFHPTYPSFESLGHFVSHMSKPNLIAIEHDDYHAKHIGCLPDGRQFFLTSPFVPAIGGRSGRDFVALFLFDKHGQFLEAHIDDLTNLDAHQASSLYKQMLTELGEVEFRRIQIQPFEVERFDTTFGLVPRPPEDDDDVWAVELQPGNYMAFFEPWDSGEYDT